MLAHQLTASAQQFLPSAGGSQLLGGTSRGRRRVQVRPQLRLAPIVRVARVVRLGTPMRLLLAARPAAIGRREAPCASSPPPELPRGSLGQAGSLGGDLIAHVEQHVGERLGERRSAPPDAAAAREGVGRREVTSGTRGRAAGSGPGPGPTDPVGATLTPAALVGAGGVEALRARLAGADAEEAAPMRLAHRLANPRAGVGATAPAVAERMLDDAPERVFEVFGLLVEPCALVELTTADEEPDGGAELAQIEDEERCDAAQKLDPRDVGQEIRRSTEHDHRDDGVPGVALDD